MTDAQKRAKQKYREKCKHLQIVVYPTEQDIIDHLATKESYSPYIKRLIRQDIQKSNGCELCYQPFGDATINYTDNGEWHIAKFCPQCGTQLKGTQ